MGDSSVFIYIVFSFFFFSSYPLLFIRCEPAICSVAPRSAIVPCLLLRREREREGEKKKKHRSPVKHFYIVSQPRGEDACRPGSKGKKLHFWKWRGAGNDWVNGQHRGSLIKKEEGGRDGLEGRAFD